MTNCNTRVDSEGRIEIDVGRDNEYPNWIDIEDNSTILYI